MVIINEIEEGSSSSSHDHKQQRVEVFLSFRGSDTRNSFTDHLYNALLGARIDTFLDDEDIDTGEDLKSELENAIKSARASIIVLSKDYATSTWCLDELALILDQGSDHVVVPIFYNIESPDEQKSFRDSMEKHVEKMEAETNPEKRARWARKIDRWNKALTEVSDLRAKVANGRKETEFIQEIVTDIRKRLCIPLSDTLPLFIGRHYDIEKITSWLTDGSSSHTAEILTISGIGGIGKTYLAKRVFFLYSRTFAKSCFINDINLRCKEKSDGLLDVQKQLYDVISKKNELSVKVFLVLDDIDSLEQLDALLGSKGFYPGSKILITTKDASLTEGCTLFKQEVEPKHTKLLIHGLYEPEAWELLCLHAFNCKGPKKGYEEVTGKLVKYCEGHPLALEFLGKSLYRKDIDYWEERLEILKDEPDKHISKVLQTSFDSLPSSFDKELFKDIACFFVGIDREISEKILKACGRKTITGIKTLIGRSLLSIGWDNRLMMHQLLQETGKAIVREESPNRPGKRSRLWCHDESFKVLKERKCSKDRRILGSLKILDLSFCEQLHKLCGFYELNKLERLIVRNCERLREICESLDECVELVYIDLSYCGNLERVPTAKRKLETDFMLLLDGCNTRGCISRALFYFVNSFGSSIVRLSLANNNLSNESFPTDLSSLTRLKHLVLDENPIVFMPHCLKSLPLEELSMANCKTLRLIEHPPCTLKRLNISMLYLLLDDTTLFEGISFNPDMSPLSIDIVPGPLFRPWSFGIEGMVKIQPLEGVEERVLSALGWTNLLDFINKRDVAIHHLGRGREQFQIQMYYEFGIFSTFYVGVRTMPDWITSIKSEETISFTIPLSPNKKRLRGLNFCYIQWAPLRLPVIEISNKTKKRTWTYQHCIIDSSIDVGVGEWLTYLSHWMFGMDEMEAGDNIVITLNKRVSDCLDMDDAGGGGGSTEDDDYTNEVEVGVGFVYEDEDEDGRMEDEDEEDPLEYYKSWNHIIGGDLSSFQLETGEYFLSRNRFTRWGNIMFPNNYMYRSRYKEKRVSFRAFSKKKSLKTPPNGAKQQAFSKTKSPKTPSNGAKRLRLSG